MKKLNLSIFILSIFTIIFLFILACSHLNKMLETIIFLSLSISMLIMYIIHYVKMKDWTATIKKYFEIHPDIADKIVESKMFVAAYKYMYVDYFFGKYIISYTMLTRENVVEISKELYLDIKSYKDNPELYKTLNTYNL